MRIYIYLKIVLFSLLLLLVQTGTAQVAIGLTEKPIDGALLQLKNIEGITDGGQNAKKGFMLPRVELTALNTLIIGGVDYNIGALKHTGLTVFNVKKDPSNGLSKAPYVWDGAKWNALYTKNLIVAPPFLYFYKSAWMPKKLPVRGIMDNSDLNVDIAIEPKAGGTVDFNGIGAIFPASPHLQTDGEEEYTFQPVENASGQELSTDVTFTASRGGDAGSVNKTTRIIHYPYEFPIHIEPSILPATLINGVGAVSIWSAADWKISASQPVDHDTQNMLATNLTLGEELRNETPLKLHINQNPTWNEKELKINVESVGADGKHYEDLAPHTLIVKQKANVPTIDISDPANKILDFGLATGTKDVTIRSNARWTAMGNSNIGDVIGSNTVLGGTQHGVNSPAVPINTAITLPATTGGNAKAGTVYSSNITFTTTDNAPATPASTTLTVNRTMPIRWESPTITPVSKPLPRAWAYFIASVGTNTDWWRGAWYPAIPDVLKTVSEYTNESHIIDISPNDSWIERDVQASIWYTVGAVKTSTVTQLGYKLDCVTNIVSETRIGASPNSNYAVHLTSPPTQGAPASRIAIKANGVWIREKDAPRDQDVFFDIPANLGVERQLFFYFLKAGLDWEYIGWMTQNPPVFEAKVTSSGGVTGTITVTSDIPFKFCIGSSGRASVSGGGSSGNIEPETSRNFSPTTLTTYTFTIARDLTGQIYYPFEYMYIKSKVIPLGGGDSTPIYTVTCRKTDGWHDEYREGSRPICSY